jgi:hypothetical protein
MNSPLAEIVELLDLLWAHREEEPKTRDPFEVFVIPNAPPSLDLYRELEDLGVTATMGMGWFPGDPATKSLEDKRAGAARFSEAFVDPLR